ncbi:MAG: hypothetical protein LBH80_05680 [Prevotellaceae bacterium]|nr:hypothetical protein [Prevotellaceae bacterium]
MNYIVPRNSQEMLVATEQGVMLANTTTYAITPCTFNKNLKSIFVTDIHIRSDSIITARLAGQFLFRLV